MRVVPNYCADLGLRALRPVSDLEMQETSFSTHSAVGNLASTQHVVREGWEIHTRVILEIGYEI